MARAGLWRIGAHGLLFLVPTLSAPASALAESADDFGALNRQVIQLDGQGKYAEANALADSVLALAERVLGKEHPLTISSVNNVVVVYDSHGRRGEAEPWQRRLRLVNVIRLISTSFQG
jgi:hypothetical protein